MKISKIQLLGIFYKKQNNKIKKLIIQKKINFHNPKNDKYNKRAAIKYFRVLYIYALLTTTGIKPIVANKRNKYAKALLLIMVFIKRKC